MQNLSTSRVLADPRTESGVCYTPPSAHEAQLPFTAHSHPEPFIRQPWCGPGLRVVPFPLQREKGEEPNNISETREGKDFFTDPEPKVLRLIHRKGFLFLV